MPGLRYLRYFGIDKIEELNENINFNEVKIVSMPKKEKCSLSEILEETSKKFKISKESIVSCSRSSATNEARKFFAYKAIKEQAYGLREVSDFINRDMSRVSRYVKESDNANNASQARKEKK